MTMEKLHCMNISYALQKVCYLDSILKFILKFTILI
jgi:hypothetical protein